MAAGQHRSQEKEHRRRGIIPAIGGISAQNGTCGRAEMPDNSRLNC